LLVDMDDDRPLSDLAVFAEDVCDAIHCRVQAVTSDSLHRLLRTRILREAKPL
jgi:predicted nucleotidyltransferase